MRDLINRKNLMPSLCSGISCNVCSFNEIDGVPGCLLAERIEALPSAEPEIIYCKDCKRHNLSVEDVWDNPSLKWCPLVAYRGKAQGHEFDYQFCVCAERKEDE